MAVEWTKSDVEILMQNYPNKEITISLLGRTWNSIQRKAQSLGLTRRRRVLKEKSKFTCIRCGNEFEAINKAKYCSLSCKSMHYDKTHPEQFNKRAMRYYYNHHEEKKEYHRNKRAKWRKENYTYKRDLFTREGERCWHQERDIDELFHQNDIEHKFQVKIGKYIADWIVWVDNKKYVVEYFGFHDRDDKIGDDYRKRAQEKIKFYKDNNLKLIAIYPRDFFQKRSKLVTKLRNIATA